MAPTQQSEIKKLVESTESKVHSLKAAIFHTMAYKMSLEINKGDITLPTRRSFLKVLYNVCQIRKKDITFEQYYRIHVHGPKIAICEITSDTVFVLNSAFTAKDNFFASPSMRPSMPSMPFFWTLGTPNNSKNTTQQPIKSTRSPNTRSGQNLIRQTNQLNQLLLTSTSSNSCFSMTSLSPIAAS